MKAPEKIYLQVCGDCEDNDCKNCKFEDLEGNITWCKDKIFDKDIEYTRTDAFIEKACEWLKENITNNPNANSVLVRNGCVTLGMLVKDFEKYMKGE